MQEKAGGAGGEIPGGGPAASRRQPQAGIASATIETTLHEVFTALNLRPPRSSSQQLVFYSGPIRDRRELARPAVRVIRSQPSKKSDLLISVQEVARGVSFDVSFSLLRSDFGSRGTTPTAQNIA